METPSEKLETWAIVELMGHRKLAGKVSEETHFGTVLLRLDTPQGDDWVTQYYGGQSIYCLTPCEEAAARTVAAHYAPEPVHRYELLPAPPVKARDVWEDEEMGL